MNCPGLHCPGCSGKGSGAALAAVAVAGYLAYRWITRPAVEHAIGQVVTVAAIIAASAAGLALAAGLTAAGLAVRRAVRRRNAAGLPSAYASAGLASGPEPVTLVSSRPIPEIAPRAALSEPVSPARAEAARRWGARP